MTKLMQLEEASYKNGLYTLVSDPSLVGSARRTKRLAIDNIPATARTWDITPIVNPPTTPDLEIVDSFQMITSDLSAISIDNQSPLITVDGQAIYKHGAAKTNINLGMLSDGDSWHVSLRVVTDGTGLSFTNLIFYDKLASAADLAASYLDSLINGTPLQSQTLVLTANRSNLNLSVNGSFYDPVVSNYKTSAPPFPIKYSVATQTANNNTCFLILSRNGNTLNIYIAIADTAGNYDIHKVHSLGDDTRPFPFYDLTMFYYAGTVANPQITYQSIVASITTPLPGNSIVGTKYEQQYAGTQPAYDLLFPVPPHRPSGITIEQAVFPEGTRVGELLNVYVDLQYVGPPPRPYGFPDLHHGQTIMVTGNSSEGKSYDRMIRSNEFDPLLQTVNNLSNGGGVSLPHGEIVVYVNNNFDTDDLLTGNRAFGSIDEAFAYLSTLPPYMPKRMVIDDRPIVIGQPIYVEGTVDNLYGFGANNIRLSTYTAFSGEPYPQAYNQYSQHRPDGSANPLLYVRNIKADVIHLVDFWGTFDLNTDGSSHVYLGDSVITPTSPTSLRAANLRLGSNAVLYAVEGTIDYYDGGAILLEDNAFLKIFFGLFKGGGAHTPLNLPFDIFKSAQARIYISTLDFGPLNILPLDEHPYHFSIYYPQTGQLPEIEHPPLATYINQVPLNYPYAPVFTLDNVIMVRKLLDFKPDYDFSGTLILPAEPKIYFIVGEVNLQGNVLYGGAGTETHRFIGFPDAKLVNQTIILASNDVNSNNSFHFSGVSLQCEDAPVIAMESGSLTIENCKINSSKGIQYDATGDLTANALDSIVKISNVEFYSSTRDVGDIVKINTKGDVVLRDILVTGDILGGQPLFDIRCLENARNLMIDGFTVQSDEKILSPVFIIDETVRSPGAISVRGVNLGNGNTSYPSPASYGLFTLNQGVGPGQYNVYDHTTDNRIVTDSSRPFLVYEDPDITIGSFQIGELVFAFLEQSATGFTSKKYGFVNNNSGRMVFVYNESMFCEISVKASVTAGPNQTLEFLFVQPNPTDSQGNGDVKTVVTDGSGNAVVDLKFFHVLHPGTNTGLAARNMTAAQNITLTNLLLTIRQL